MRLHGIARCLWLTAAFVMSSPTAHAYPLSQSSFNKLASACAPDVNPSTLRAVADVESRFEPWAIRDNTTHQSWSPPALTTAIDLASSRQKLGHSIDLGLMQINSINLAPLGLRLSDAFDACRSLDAAGRILRMAYTTGGSETDRQAATLITLSRYNTGRPLAGIVNGYANQVLTAQRTSDFDKQTRAKIAGTHQDWNIWDPSKAEQASWVVTADGSSETERAGAQTSDARSEGRAPTSPSEKGEPYELFAYQESEAPKP